MVVGSKQGLGPGRMLVQVFGYGPGNGNTVISAGSPSDLIQKYQATFGEVVEDRGRFVHFYHKGRFPHGNVVTGTYPGKYFVHIAYPGRSGRDKTAHLGQ